MNKNLIPVFSGSLSDSETLLCDARKLHEFLQVSSRFNCCVLVPQSANLHVSCPPTLGGVLASF